MKKQNRLIAMLTILIALLGAFALAACTKTDTNDSVSDLTLEAGADYIIVKDYSYPDNQNRATEFKLDNGNWQDGESDGTKYIIFENLLPNTEYTVFARGKKYSNEPFSKKVTTLKQNADAPIDVSYEQANKTITLIGVDSGMEFSYDSGDTWITDNSHTYSSNGEKEILVRYKETNSKNQSGEFIVNVLISDFYGGRGTEAEPYLVNSLEQFINISTLNGSRAHFKLSSDIQFTEEPITKPISCYTFDGNGKKLINPKIQISSDDEKYSGRKYIALFSSALTVKNVTVENAVLDATATDTNPIIAILAASVSEISNCHVSGEINILNERILGSSPKVGGLVGMVSKIASASTILVDACSADIDINYFSESNAQGILKIGGLIGEYAENNILSITNSYANINFEFLGLYNGNIGGIIGDAKNTNIADCYSTGVVVTQGDVGDSASAGLAIGGIVGKLVTGSVGNSYATMNISCDGSKQSVIVGGIAAALSSTSAQTVTNCFFAGNIYITTGAKTYLRNALIATVTPAYIITNCYHSDNLITPIETNNSIAVAEATMKTINWQKNTLEFSAEIWDFTEGEYPIIKL